ncbi:MAG TPA: hypothetical protein VL854_01045 [Nitrososphaeraceae archaeon]|jgi:hypothetical protein|nr:hypothetical protein [Nitrososphaeraceae archaeon]
MEQRSLEEALLEQLKYSNVDREKLSDAVRTIVEISGKTKTKPIRIFPKGIPYPDGWGWWNWFTKKEELGNFINLVVDSNAVPSIYHHIFPIGIPDPEGWLVENTLGAVKGHST